MSRRRARRNEFAQAEDFTRLVVFAVLALALGVGGLAHFKDALLVLIIMGVWVVAIAVFLFIIWRLPRIPVAAKVSLTFGLLAGMFFWQFHESWGQLMVAGFLAGGAGVTGFYSWLNWINDSDARTAAALLGPRRKPAETLVLHRVFPSTASPAPAKTESPEPETALLPSVPLPEAVAARRVPVAPVESWETTVQAALCEIDWYQFEKLMEQLLRLEGRSVVRSGGANPDNGIDLAVRDPDGLTIVQCKQWARPIRKRTIYEAVGIRECNRAGKIILATNGPVSDPARRLAQAHQVAILDRAEIQRRLIAVDRDRIRPHLDASNKRCPKCEAPLVFRSGTGWQFWGCSNYGRLKCDGKIEIPAAS